MHPNRFYTFRCPECKNEFTYDEPGEPMCDGLGDTRSHEPKVMHRIRVKDRDYTKEVSPQEGLALAKGTLLTASAITTLKMRVKGKLWTPKDGLDPLTGEEMNDALGD